MSTPIIHCRSRMLVSGGLALCLTIGCTANETFVRSMRLSKVTLDELPEKPPKTLQLARDFRPSPPDALASEPERELPVADRVSRPRQQELAQSEPMPEDVETDDVVTAALDEIQETDERPSPLVETAVRQQELTVASEFAADSADTLAFSDPTEDSASQPSIRFQVPPELPGSEAPILHAPEIDQSLTLEQRKALIEPLYPKLPPISLAPDEDESEPLWSLADLQSTAWENHPALMQAAAQIEIARGGMIQAGLHPNPTMGWEQDTIGPGIQGYKGPYLTQEIVTGGKLKLSRAAASMEYENAQVAYQRMRIDIATLVRNAYYDLLVAKKRREMQRALVRFTDEIFRAQVDLVAGGQAAPYEPLQLRVFAMQARNTVVNAENGVVAAGRRLGAAIGILEQQHFRTVGQADQTPTEIEYNRATAYLLENHTELRIVRNEIVQSQYLSRLEYIRPRIPDISFYGTYQHAYGVPPFVNTYNFQVGAPIPIFDRNQGRILATQSSIINRERAFAAVQNDLTGKLAEILNRYDTARTLSVNYRQQILPDQVRSYRGVYSRYRAGQEVNFGDVIVAQQTLSNVMNDYGNVLDQMWQAYVDLAEVLQLEDVELLSSWFGPL